MPELRLSREKLLDARGVFVIAWITFLTNKKLFESIIKWDKIANANVDWVGVGFNDCSIEEMLRG